ncbi:HNH endonuclease signature motif containing protein [Rhodococcus sp. HS-D2]|uniref:HNH endonuclease signature motif containing protein n=1 Tax=Rhodococcus sp. HS-D2 TaxID=1384636 RepID=UPI0018D332C4|nr:HNH endonuclease signature motif containing protein [Rhodococcus sp. HS-D2]
MNHPLKGTKQTPEHIAKRVANYPKVRKLQDPKIKIERKVKITDAGCWQWVGAIFQKPTGSYGQLRVGRRGEAKVVRAHRYSYETYVGAIPQGLVLDHLCRNTLCVNPDHLEAVTQKVNMSRGRHATKSKCVNGHSYTASNTYFNSRGARECRTCRGIRYRKRKN